MSPEYLEQFRSIPIYIPIVHGESKLVTILHTSDSMLYEIDQYTFIPNKDGDSYKFYELQEAIDWVLENVKPELIDKSDEDFKALKDNSIRDMYLSNKDNYD